MQLALVKWMPAQMKALLANCSAGVSPAKSKPCNCHSCLDRTAPRAKMRYGLGATDGAAFWLEISGSFLSL